MNSRAPERFKSLAVVIVISCTCGSRSRLITLGSPSVAHTDELEWFDGESEVPSTAVESREYRPPPPVHHSAE